MPQNKAHPELWLAETNRADWEEIYLKPEYWEDLKPGWLRFQNHIQKTYPK